MLRLKRRPRLKLKVVGTVACLTLKHKPRPRLKLWVDKVVYPRLKPRLKPRP